ncbi:MAG: DNA polymerase II [Thermofilaceae archaeon]
MRLEFWLLDASYEMVGGVPEVRLWGIDREGKRVVVLDRSFRPYVYVLPVEGKENQVAERIYALSSKYNISNIELLEKKYFGKEVKVLKVTLTSPRDVPQLRETLLKIESIHDVLESDIRFYMRYMIDKGVYPCSWHEITVKEISNEDGWRVDSVYLAENSPQYIGFGNPPQLRIYAFDIECYNPFGEPNPERDPIIVISVATGQEDVRLFTTDSKDDKTLLQQFVKDLLEYDPDVIVGYNSNRFDWPYILTRCKAHRIKLNISRGGGEPTLSAYGHYSIVGRANVDLYDYADEISEIKIKTLDNVADYLGVKAKSDRLLIDASKVHEYWDDLNKRPLFFQYAKDDADSTFGLAEKFLPFAVQLSSLVGLTLDQVGAASVGYRVEWHLMRAAFEFDELIPNRTERPYEPYKGAIVLKPKPGVHKNVAVLDFSSMYPNLMIKYNISPDTLLLPEEERDENNINIAPEVKHAFRKTPPGFYKKVLERLLNARKEVRERMKGLDPESSEYRILEERQKAIKVIANATYGYCGWVGARWYRRQVAEATTAWGRKTISETIKLAQNLGLVVIYGDTDSVFVIYEPDKISKLINIINENLNLDIKVDKLYKKIFFTEAKKRYCGLLENGRIDVVGLEAVRGDWAELAREVQEKVIEIILREEDVGKAVNYVRGIIENLYAGKIPLEKLIVWKTLTKSPEDYEVETAHVIAAKKLMEAGYKVPKGGKIGFIISKGKGGEKLSEKAIPYVLVRNVNEIDADYYIRRQILPATLRILEYFGIKDEQLLEKGQQTLLDFFG